MVYRTFGAARYLVAIAVIGFFLAGTILLFYGGFTLIISVVNLITAGPIDPRAAQETTLIFIELADQFLIAVVFYFTALGLYTLFIDDKAPVPAHLRIRSIDELKAKLVATVIVVLGVNFLGEALTWDGQRDLIGLGVAVGLVVAALAYFLRGETTSHGA